MNPNVDRFVDLNKSMIPNRFLRYLLHLQGFLPRVPHESPVCEGINRPAKYILNGEFQTVPWISAPGYRYRCPPGHHPGHVNQKGQVYPRDIGRPPHSGNPAESGILYL